MTWNRPKIIHVEAPELIRSLDLNEYYFGVVLEIISIYSGHTKDELHDIFISELLPLVIFRDYQDLTSTTCTNQELWAYIQKVRHFFTKFTGIYIPDPNKVLRPKFQQWPTNNIENFDGKTQN